MSIFSDLTSGEAKQFLKDFLETESKILAETILLKKQDGKILEVHPDCMVDYFKEFDPLIRPQYKALPEGLPPEIANHPFHQMGEPWFDESANMSFLRLGYFFGECLIGQSNKLSWGVGDFEYFHGGAPVIKGFQNDNECAPIHVCQTLIARITEQGLSFDEYRKTFDYWLTSI